MKRLIRFSFATALALFSVWSLVALAESNNEDGSRPLIDESVYAKGDYAEYNKQSDLVNKEIEKENEAINQDLSLEDTSRLDNSQNNLDALFADSVSNPLDSNDIKDDQTDSVQNNTANKDSSRSSISIDSSNIRTDGSTEISSENTVTQNNTGTNDLNGADKQEQSTPANKPVEKPLVPRPRDTENLFRVPDIELYDNQFQGVILSFNPDKGWMSVQLNSSYEIKSFEVDALKTSMILPSGSKGDYFEDFVYGRSVKLTVEDVESEVPFVIMSEFLN